MDRSSTGTATVNGGRQCLRKQGRAAAELDAGDGEDTASMEVTSGMQS